MTEYDAYEGYPEPPTPRVVGPKMRTIHDRIGASYRDKSFYDGPRSMGYGGMRDDGRWAPIAHQMYDHYNLGYAHVLQLNAHKGYLLSELFKLGCRVSGQEVSHYAAEQSIMRLTVCPFTELPYEDGQFDFVIAASAVYSLNLPDAIKCLREIQRVGSGRSWITLAAYEAEDDIEGLMLLRHWFLLGTTILTKADWLEVLAHAGYEGDYRFDTAKSLRLVRA